MLRPFLTVCLVLPLYGQIAAQENQGKALPPLLSFTGSTTRVLEQSAIEIPLTWVSQSVPAARVRQVIRDGIELNPGAFTVEAIQRGADQLLIVNANPNLAAEAGKYELTVILIPASRDAGETVLKDPAQLKLTLTRAKKVDGKGVLQIVSPLKVERIIKSPWDPPIASPKEWVIAETGGLAGVQPEPAQVVAPIYSARSSSLGRLKATFGRLSTSGQGVAKLAFDGNEMWVGEANARMLVHAPTLAKTPAVYTVAVRSRLWYGWLVVAIFVGVLLGNAVKKWLEARAEMLRARVAAEELRQRIRVYEIKIGDVDVRHALLLEREKLEKIMRRRILIKTTLDDAVKDAGKATDALVKKAEEDRKSATATLQMIRGAIGDGDQPPPFDTVVSAAGDTLDAQLELLRSGQITAATAALSKLETELPRRVREPFESWLAAMRIAVADFGDWPEFPVLNDALARIKATLETIKAPQNLAETGATLRATSAIASELRNTVARMLPRIAELVKQAGDTTLAAELTQGFALPGAVERASRVVARARALVPKPQVKGADALAPTIMAATITDSVTAPPSIELPPFTADDEPLRSKEDLEREIALTSSLRDAVYGILIIIAGVIIFRGNFLGTLEDLFGALLWGFSVDLSAATLTTYASPLLARRPFR